MAGVHRKSDDLKFETDDLVKFENLVGGGWLRPVSKQLVMSRRACGRDRPDWNWKVDETTRQLTKF